MNTAQVATMVTLHFSMSQGKNHYTRTSIDTLLYNLKIHHNRIIKRRWLFECIRGLLDAGYIRRRSRYRHDTDGLISQIPSLMMFTLKGVEWLKTMGIGGAAKLHKTMLAYLRKKDKRWPHQDDFDDGSWEPHNPDDQKRFKRLLGTVGTRI